MCIYPPLLIESMSYPGREAPQSVRNEVPQPQAREQHPSIAHSPSAFLRGCLSLPDVSHICLLAHYHQPPNLPHIYLLAH